MPGVLSRVQRENIKSRALAFYKVSLPPLLQLSCCATNHIIPPDIYRNEPLRRRECLYYLALGYYKMGNYEEAKSFVGMRPAFPYPSNQADVAEGRLLEKEPTNLQAQSLNTLIEEKATRGEPPPKHFPTLADAFS